MCLEWDRWWCRRLSTYYVGDDKEGIPIRQCFTVVICDPACTERDVDEAGDADPTAIGVFGVLNHYGLIDPAFVNLLWPLLLIVIGVAMLARGPRWRAGMRERMHDRWERRMHRHFGPGWANLSEDERERFRAGMRQWRSHCDRDAAGVSPAATPASNSSLPRPSAQPPAPGEQR